MNIISNKLLLALFSLVWASTLVSANTQHVSDGCVGQFGCGGGGASNYSFIYDANGNRLQGFGFWYEYNGFNQLFRVRQGSASGQVVEEYTYDANGIRLTKFEPQLNQMTYYVGEDFVLVENASGVFPETYYRFNGQQVARKDASNATFFSHPDHLGSTTLVTNAAGGVVEETRYEPFGNSLVEFTGQSGRYSYTGKEKDVGTGLMYYGARFYDPVRGQFTQPDSIIPDSYNPQTLNRYAYVINNPYKYTDPTGKSPLDIAFLAYDANEYYNHPTLLNGVFLAIDVVTLVLPVVGASVIAKGLIHGSDIAKGASKATELVKVGESAEYVEKAAESMKYQERSMEILKSGGTVNDLEMARTTPIDPSLGETATGFTNDLLGKHFSDHGSQWGSSTAPQYQQTVKDFLSSKFTLSTFERVRPNGEYVKYDAAYNAYAAMSKAGVLKTGFSPSTYGSGLQYFLKRK